MYVLGIDVGTTGTKTLAVDPEGRVLGRGYQEYPLRTPRTGWVEQDAEDWWRAVVSSVQRATESLDRREAAALCLSAQGASMTAVDRDFRPLCPVLTWMDRRAGEDAAALGRRLGEDAFYRKSGWRLDPGLDAAKLAWMRRRQPEIYAEAACFVSTIDFINGRLTGCAVLDPTSAAIRQLMDIQSGGWDESILDVLGLGPSRLPAIRPTGDRIGCLTKAAASALGLPEGLPVFNGAHDQYCAAVGSGALEAGQMLLATGTTWVVLGITKRLLYVGKGIAPGIHPVPGLYGAMASLYSAGSALNWYTSLVGEDYRALDEKAALCRESAADLLFYPYLAGAGPTHAAPEQRGVLLGLDLHHSRYDIALALMEGVAFEVRRVLEEFSKQDMPISRLIMTGGAVRSRLWSSLTGYVTGCEITGMQEPETCCMGAAMLAAVGLGWYTDLAACAGRMIQGDPLPLYDTTARRFYDEKYARYMAAMPAGEA